ncbi:transposase [Ktedonospora formicarum]|uniref:Transposase IS204/IS1001/IS1096/IS1165 DDE domain-containing protein n=1 Tax=Ktedonospora formicarum TaxID=2778364 RepID=A0A8J3MY87_9CHLR|nr:transposase [Ktedonospora formicarum]GHO50726.1 hypothetical protein KSX_88890 [Ktedonospora formicarum]
MSSATPLSDVPAKLPPRYHRSHPRAAELSQAKREERIAQYEQVVALRKQGFSQTAIANRVGIAHSTVSRWLRCDTYPERQPPLRKTGVDAHLPFLRERWGAGCHNIMQMYRELLERGYKGSYQSVYDQVFRLLPGGTKNAALTCNLSAAPLSSRSAAFLFLRQLEALSTDEQQTLITLKQLDPEIELAYNLVRQFAQMLHMRTGEQLDAWLESTRASQIRELQGFVKSVERDKAAVLAGLTLPRTTITLHNAPRHLDQYHIVSARSGCLSCGRKRQDPRSL